MLWGLDLFDKDKIKEEYNSFSEEWKGFIKNDIDLWKKSYTNPMCSHKEFLSLIRDKL